MSDPVLGGRIDKAVLTALNGLATRQRVISNNLANVDTPGFKASEVRFEEELQRAVARDQKESAPSSLRVADYKPGQLALDGNGTSAVDLVQPTVVSPSNTTARIDGNNVDIDKEMVQLAETTISYSSLVQLLASRVAMAKYAVNEGRR